MACRRVTLRFEACEGGAVYQLVSVFPGDAEVITGAFEAGEGIGGVRGEDRGEACGGSWGDQAERMPGDQLGEAWRVGKRLLRVLRVVL